MDRLLTPIVSRLLSRFVKSAAGKDGSDLRASLSGGKVVLYNLELDLGALFEGLPVVVDRAFAKQLTVSIPWTSLGSQPILVQHTQGKKDKGAVRTPKIVIQVCLHTIVTAQMLTSEFCPCYRCIWTQWKSY